MMACGPATDLQKMGSLHDLGKCSAFQAEVNHNPTCESSSGTHEVQSCHKSWNKPVKLKLDELLQPASAKKMAQRELFGPGRNLMKDIQNKTGARKTLSNLPRAGPSAVRRPSGTFKAPLVKVKSMVNSRPSVGQSQCYGYRRDSQIYRQKTHAPLAPSYITKTQKISASSAKKEAVTVSESKTSGSSVTAIPSRRVNVSRKVMGHIPHLANLENSVNLLNVDEVEEKLVNEKSLLKSQLLKEIHKSTKDVNSCDVTKEQKILNEQTVINEKLKHMDEKLDTTLNELTNLKELIKKLSSNQDTECKSCSCQCHTTNSTVTKSSANTATSNLEQKVIEPTSDIFPDTDNCVPDSERKAYSLRRSLRLSNKNAQCAYDSLRKSTKLLATPVRGSAKMRNTPGRLTRNVIAQLNDLYRD